MPSPCSPGTSNTLHSVTPGEHGNTDADQEVYTEVDLPHRPCSPNTPFGEHGEVDAVDALLDAFPGATIERTGTNSEPVVSPATQTRLFR